MADKGHNQNERFAKIVEFPVGIKDDNVTPAVNIGDASNVVYNTNNQTVLGTINELLTNTLSAGYLSGGALTDNLDGTIDVAAGAGYIKESDNDSAVLKYITWNASAGISLTDNVSTYVYINYNGGSPTVAITTSGSVVKDNENDQFELYEIFREGTTLHITEHRQYTVNSIRRMQQRFYSVSNIQRADSEGGLIIGETGTRNITMTAGLLWTKLNSVAVSSIDTSGSDTYDRYYRDGVGGWTKEASQTQWNNTQYDDGSGTLATMTNNWYSFQEFYIEADGDIVSVYGQNQFATVAGAETAAVTAEIPPRLDAHGLYMARLVFQKSGATAETIESAFGKVLTGATVTNHGSLAGLAADDHLQYLLLAGRGGQTIVDAVTVTGSLDVDNLQLNGNTLSSTDTNGDINLTPDGTGSVVFSTDLEVDNLKFNGNTISSTNTNGDIILTPDGTGSVVFSTDLEVDNLKLNGNTISSTDTNGDINITPDGTGDVLIINNGFFYKDNIRIKDDTIICEVGDFHINPVTGSALVLDTNTTIDGGVVENIGSIKNDNIKLDDNTLSSTDVNGNINLDPDALGKVIIKPTDGGSDQGKLIVNGLTGSTAHGPHIACFGTSDSTNPIFQLFALDGATQALGFAAYNDADGSGWRSSHNGSNFRIFKQSNVFEIDYDSGVTAGDLITWNKGIVLDTSGNIGIGQTVAGLGKMEIRGTPSSAANGPHTVYSLTTDPNYPTSHFLNWSHSQITLGFDAYRDAAGWQSSDLGSNFAISKTAGFFTIFFDNGNPKGNAVAFKSGFAMNQGGEIFLNFIRGTTGGVDMRMDLGTREIFYDSSAARYKENINYTSPKILDRSIATIEGLKIANFDRKDGSKKDEIGMIAEDVNEICPEVVCEGYANFEEMEVQKNLLRDAEANLKMHKEELNLDLTLEDKTKELQKAVDDIVIPEGIKQIGGYNKSDLVPYLIKYVQYLNSRIKKLEAICVK